MVYVGLFRHPNTFCSRYYCHKAFNFVLLSSCFSLPPIYGGIHHHRLHQHSMVFGTHSHKFLGLSTLPVHLGQVYCRWPLSQSKCPRVRDYGHQCSYRHCRLGPTYTLAMEPPYANFSKARHNRYFPHWQLVRKVSINH